MNGWMDEWMDLNLTHRIFIIFHVMFLMCMLYVYAKPPCRSFGVVLWEMLTGEVPYKDVDSSAIIWGVGNNSLHLPVPESCPDSFKLLLRQCW